MGINKAGECLHSLKGLSLEHLHSIASRFQVRHLPANSRVDYSPLVVIDANWLAYKLAGKSKSYDNLESRLVEFSSLFVKNGFQVTIVCDANTRHHSKRATIDRAAKRERARILSLKYRTKLMHLKNELNDCGQMHFRERDLINGQIALVEKKIAAAERTCQQAVGPEFSSNLQLHVALLNDRGGQWSSNPKFAQADFQADSLIVSLCNARKGAVVISNDSDIAVLAVENCILVESFNHSKSKDLICKLSVKTGSRNLIELSLDCLDSVHDREKVESSYAKTPLFEGVELETRCIFAVILGCDVLPGGVAGKGPVTVLRQKEEMEKKGLNINEAENWYNWITTKTKTPIRKEVFETCVQALLYEPARESGCSSCTYISTPPTTLPRYLSAFTTHADIIFEGPELATCKGRGDNHHTYMVGEGQESCASCSVVMCRFCIMEDDEDSKDTTDENKKEAADGKKKFCSKCLVEDLSLPNEDPTECMTKRILTDAILNCSECEIPVIGATLPELIEMHEMYVLKGVLEVHSNDIGRIIYPRLPSEALDDGTLESVVEFNLHYGGSFVRNEVLGTDQIVELTTLLATLVTYSKRREVNEMRERFHVIPDLLVDIAEGSRVGTGHRLLTRCARHAMDPSGVPITSAKGFIFVCDGKIGIYTHHKIKASMKELRYSNRLAFNIDGVLACSCKCPSGAYNEDGDKLDRHLCVHVLPHMYLWSLFLYSGLAQHYLCELQVRWSTENEKEMDPTLKNVMMESILTLMNAARCKAVGDATTVYDMLRLYAVGTERSLQMPPPPHPAEIESLRDMGRLVSPEKKAQDLVKPNPTRLLVLSQSSSNASDAEGSVAQTGTDVSVPSPGGRNETTVPMEEGIVTGDREDACDNPTMQNWSQIKNPVAVTAYTVNYSRIWTCLEVLGGIGKFSDSSVSEAMECIGTKLVQYRAGVFGEDGTDSHHKDSAKKKLSPLRTEWRRILLTDEYGFRSPKHKGPRVHAIQDLGEDLEAETTLQSMDDAAYLANSGYEGGCALTEHRLDTEEADGRELVDSVCYQESDNEFFVATASPEVLEERHVSESMLAGSMVNSCSSYDGGDAGKLSAEATLEVINEQFVCEDNGAEVNCVTQGEDSLRNSEASLSTPPRRKQSEVSGDRPADSIPARRKKRIHGKETHAEGSPKRKKRRKWKKTLVGRYSKKCCHFMCDRTNSKNEPSTTWHRVPNMPKQVKPDAAVRERMTYNVKKLKRELVLKRIGHVPANDVTEYWFCGNHPVEVIEKRVKVKTGPQCYEMEQFAFQVPKSVPLIVPPSRGVSKGNAKDRATMKLLTKMNEEDDPEVNRLRLLNIQREERLEDKTLGCVNESLKEATGLSASNTLPSKKMCISTSRKKVTPFREVKASVHPMDTSDKEVKLRTGFEDLYRMLAFIVIVCNGCVETVVSTETSLTWFEEWFIYFEWAYGKTKLRYEDLADAFKTSRGTVSVILSAKLEMVLRARQSWPKYVTLAEDEFFRRHERWLNYIGQRVILWDNTSLPLPKPSCARYQKTTWSAYYGMNCAKGGVFVQLCGWLGVGHLWAGAISDTDYMMREGVLQYQNAFVAKSMEPKTNFMNILDKGYRLALAAWRCGKQLIMQPAFVKSDRSFATKQVLYSASVASDRSGNERAVRQCKMSHRLAKGIVGKEGLERHDDLWLCWSFQSNFMFKPVL